MFSINAALARARLIEVLLLGRSTLQSPKGFLFGISIEAFHGHRTSAVC
jgi:hypothetical protein